jgi:uncharacterized BrkB/YihY/UPF0761 family membrane protein
VDPSVSEQDSPPPTETAEAEAGRLAAARAKANEAGLRLVAARNEHASIDISFCWLERERGLAATVLAGGIAYRLFFWLLPVALVLGGVLGFSSAESAESNARHIGLTGTAAKAVGDSVSDTGSARWVLLLTGVATLLWTSSWSMIAMRRVFALIWGVAPPTGGNPLKHALAFSGVLAGLVAILAGGAWLRGASDVPGLVEFLTLGAFFGVWLWISARLPHADAPVRALLPGAALMAVGAQVIYAFSVFYVAVKLERSSALYGALGVAATFLFVLYIIGRLVVSSAVLNAELWRRKQEEARSGSPG